MMISIRDCFIVILCVGLFVDTIINDVAILMNDKYGNNIWYYDCYKSII